MINPTRPLIPITKAASAVLVAGTAHSGTILNGCLRLHALALEAEALSAELLSLLPDVRYGDERPEQAPLNDHIDNFADHLSDCLSSVEDCVNAAQRREAMIVRSGLLEQL